MGFGSGIWVDVLVSFQGLEPWSQEGGPKEKRLQFRVEGNFPVPAWRGRAQFRSRDIGKVPASKLRAWVWDQLSWIQELVLASEPLFRSIPVFPSRPRYFLDRIRNWVEEPLSFPLRPVLDRNKIFLIPALEGEEEEEEDQGLWRQGHPQDLDFWFPNGRVVARAMRSWFGEKGQALLVLNQV